MARKRKGERADGLIQISVSLGRDENGKRIRKVVYGHTRQEAERKRDELLQQMAGGARYTPDITVAEWVDAYLAAYRVGVNPLHMASDDVAYNRLKKALGGMELRNAREIDLQGALNEIAGMAYSTVTKYRQAIQRVFKKAYKNRLIAHDPSEDLTMPSCTRGTHRALTMDEVRLFTANWREAGASGLWMMLMLYAGLRRGEMMGLSWGAVDMDARTLTVKQVGIIQHNQIIIEDRAKTAAGLRVIPIPAPLFNALNTIPAAERSGLVCRTQHGEPLTETAVRRGLNHFCAIMTRIRDGERLNQSGRRTDLEEAGSRPASPISFRLHDLRHTYCTLLYSAGVDVKTAAYLMGHADVTVTMKIYTHLSEERKADSTSGLLAFFDEIQGQKNDNGSKLVVTE